MDLGGSLAYWVQEGDDLTEDDEASAKPSEGDAYKRQKLSRIIVIK